jgi:hypothetical protein
MPRPGVHTLRPPTVEEEGMTTDKLVSGLHTRFRGVEYRIVSTFGWSLWSPTPASGFSTMPGKSGYYRRIEGDPTLPCYRVRNIGSYRGVPVEVTESSHGRFLLAASDARAGSVGFSQQGRGEWVLFVNHGDEDLRYTTTRSPVAAPWLEKRG